MSVVLKENSQLNYDKVMEGSRKRNHFLSPTPNKRTKPNSVQTNVSIMEEKRVNQTSQLNESVYDRLSGSSSFKKPSVARKEIFTKPNSRVTPRVETKPIVKPQQQQYVPRNLVQSRTPTSFNTSFGVSKSPFKSPGINRVKSPHRSQLTSPPPKVDFRPKFEESERQREQLMEELNEMKALIKEQKDLISQIESNSNKTSEHFKHESQEAKNWKLRCEQLEHKTKDLESLIQKAEVEKMSLIKMNEANEKKLTEIKVEISHLQEELAKNQVAHRLEVATLNEKHVNEVKSVKLEFETKIKGLTEEFDKNLKEETDDHNKKVRILNKELDATKTDLTYAIQESREKDTKMTSLESKIHQLMKEKSELEALRKRNEEERKYLHNQVQELKGNIRVFCRCRPMLKKEGDLSHMAFPLDKNGFECGIDLEMSDKKKHSFSFDRVFKPDATQTVVFEEISQLVQSALDGFKVCIFAYGQTGSGKTYTMEGPTGGIFSEQVRGMIPRSVDQIFKTASEMASIGWKYQIIASYLEIYNEEINDLLVKKPKNVKYEIKHDGKGNTSVTELEYIEVKDADEVMNLLKIANKNRQVAQTKCNDHSSRSHSVFGLSIIGKNESTGHTVNGLLNLIDLAGSERLKESKATGERLKETQSINSSLSYLGDVIHALANKEKHVPFRNSQLTYLLQNCLGGDCKTLMFVNIAPNIDSLNETVNSLRFASKVNACQIGTAKKRVTTTK